MKQTKKMLFLTNFLNALLRRKRLDRSHLSDTRLNRCLSTFDLTALGMSGMISRFIYLFIFPTC